MYSITCILHVNTIYSTCRHGEYQLYCVLVMLQYIVLQNDSLFDNVDYYDSCYYRKKLKLLMLDMPTFPIKFLEKQLKEVFNSH